MNWERIYKANIDLVENYNSLADIFFTKYMDNLKRYNSEVSKILKRYSE